MVGGERQIDEEKSQKQQGHQAYDNGTVDEQIASRLGTYFHFTHCIFPLIYAKKIEISELSSEENLIALVYLHKNLIINML